MNCFLEWLGSRATAHLSKNFAQYASDSRIAQHWRSPRSPPSSYKRQKSDMSCPAIGAGCIPEAEVIRILRDSGYSGWLTVEHFGARDMLKAANPICQETEAWHPLAFRKHYKP